LVERIRQDEAIHVAYLQTVVSELRSFTFKTEYGRQVPGKMFIDPIWNGMCTGIRDDARARRERGRAVISERIKGGPDGARRLAAFVSLEERGRGVRPSPP